MLLRPLCTQLLIDANTFIVAHKSCWMNPLHGDDFTCRQPVHRSSIAVWRGHFRGTRLCRCQCLWRKMSAGRARRGNRRVRAGTRVGGVASSAQPDIICKADSTPADPAELLLHCRVGVFWPDDDRFYRVCCTFSLVNAWEGRGACLSTSWWTCQCVMVDKCEILFRDARTSRTCRFIFIYLQTNFVLHWMIC